MESQSPLDPTAIFTSVDPLYSCNPLFLLAFESTGIDAFGSFGQKFWDFVAILSGLNGGVWNAPGAQSVT